MLVNPSMPGLPASRMLTMTFQALMCFGKAQDHRGETIARAKIHEEDGRICAAQDDSEGFRQNLEAAVGLFLELNLIGEASSSLERMAQFERAAGESDFAWLLNLLL